VTVVRLLEVTLKTVQLPSLSQKSIEAIDAGSLDLAFQAGAPTPPVPLLLGQSGPTTFEPLHLPAKLLLQSVDAATKVLL
jgi:hypothetical protein